MTKAPQNLRTIDPRAGTVHLICHLALIGLFLTLAAHGSIWGIIPAGVCMGALFPVMHEATHRHIFMRVGANHRLAFWTGAVLLVPATWFRHFHHAHHRYTQDPDRDPELMQPRPQTVRAYVWHLTSIPAWISSVSLLVRQAMGRHPGDTFVPFRAQGKIRAEAQMILASHLGFLCLGMLTLPILVAVTYASLAVGQIFLRAFLLAEHGGLPFVDQVFKNTRTTAAAAWLRWLTWNMSFHVEHHHNPSVPYDKLPAYHFFLGCKACPSYIAFHKQFWRRLIRKPS